MLILLFFFYNFRDFRCIFLLAVYCCCIVEDNKIIIYKIETSRFFFIVDDAIRHIDLSYLTVNCIAYITVNRKP